jgi:superfamily II DNA or RNA helicase
MQTYPLDNAQQQLKSPFLVLNCRNESVRVLTRIQRELESCANFRFYVAFVNQEGVTSLLQTLEDLKNRNISGQILLSQYLNFTDPMALRTLLKLRNIDLRIAIRDSMHAKGYYFNCEHGISRYIIGSSNWTASALSTNTELNIQVESTSASSLASEIDQEFSYQFSKAIPVTLEFIESYEQRRALKSLSMPQLSTDSNEFSNQVLPLLLTTNRPSTFSPNTMQEEALASLAALRSSGKNKALLISATGTGKTFLSAFDVQAHGAQRMLFVVHRENIARAALKSFQQIFGQTKKLGLYTGNEKDCDADFLFCTIQTMSKCEHLNRFTQDHFDYIVVDESHRAGAATYANFLNYFRAKFLLGMTATPERTDGADIFKYFDYNIPYEIRLQRALEEQMLCPFHYFGVTDLTVNGEEVEEYSDFNKLTAAERVCRIIEKLEFYNCDDGVVRGLIFCSRVDEAKTLSIEFNKRSYRTVALDGNSSEEDRELAISRLEAASDAHEKLDYILTVDIFNEGVDIPQCNQIVLLRPTQSPIVFVQQLGRGLRKIDSKKNKYLTVIDFIGNYTNNFLIPIALFGDRTYDKDSIRRLLVSGNEGLPGSSTINFDRIAREKIFKSINSANTKKLKDLKTDFFALKSRIGRSPMMCDFVAHDLRDPRSFADYSGSFYAFAKSIDSDEFHKTNLKSEKY